MSLANLPPMFTLTQFAVVADEGNDSSLHMSPLRRSPMGKLLTGFTVKSWNLLMTGSVYVGGGPLKN
jgi:hypothetical protein